MDQKLIEYIIKEIDKGFTHIQIKKVLLEVGHDAEVIDEHIMHVITHHRPRGRPKEIPKLDEMIFASIGIAVCILIIAGLCAYLVKSNSSEALMNEGWKLYNEDNFDRAVKKFERLAKKDPFNGYKGLGYCYMEQGRYQDSLNNFDKALELRPDDAGIYAGFGLNFYKNGENDRAIEYFERAIDQDNNDASLERNFYHVLAKIYMDMEEYEKSVEVLKKRNEISQTPSNLGLLGIALIKMGNSDEAFEHLQLSSELGSNDFFTQAGLGRYYAQILDFDNSAAHFSKALSNLPDETYSYFRYSKQDYSEDILLSGTESADGKFNACFLYAGIGMASAKSVQTSQLGRYLLDAAEQKSSCVFSEEIRAKMTSS